MFQNVFISLARVRLCCQDHAPFTPARHNFPNNTCINDTKINGHAGDNGPGPGGPAKGGIKASARGLGGGGGSRPQGVGDAWYLGLHSSRHQDESLTGKLKT